MEFSDIHIHALCGVDDGATDEKHMLAMVDMDYRDGVRLICLTPHYNPGFFGENEEKSEAVFARLSEIAAERYPDLRLILGNEIRFTQGCTEWLRSRRCRTMGNSRYVLVDFSEMEERNRILNGIMEVINSGYLPILAHVERYVRLYRCIDDVIDLRARGVLIQVDTQSVLGQFGIRAAKMAKKLLKKRLVDFISSDAHDTHDRTAGMSECFFRIEKLCGTEYAEEICGKAAAELLRNA